jgi:chloride channel protein, CIC family
MGLEGPSIYAGAAIGTSVQGRLARLFARDDAKLLLVAGAAAGVSAVFKAPATGVIFALEVPYTDDVARRALIPSLVASATSYLVFVSVVGTEPLLPRFGVGPDFGLLDLGGALLLGILAGGGARMFAALMHRAKRVSGAFPAWQRVLGAGLGLAALALLTDVVYGAPLSLGPGYQVVTWVGQAQEELALVALLFAIRLAATTLTVGGGGAGGLFIPLVIQGLLLGRLVGNVVGDPTSGLFPVIGIAAFLGAGYRTPIASVMFVAETTGLATYVVPALVAAAVSQLMMGRSSVSPVQVSARLGHLERRFRLPISSAISTDVLTVPPDASVSEFVWVHALGRRERTVPVVEGARYLGMCDLDRAAEVPREQWDTMTVADIMRSDLPVGQPAWTLRDVVAAMEEAAVDQLPVTDGSGAFVGVVSNAEILKLDEILDETGG